MGLCTLVTRRNGTYEFRKRVPADLQAILGKKTINKSLGTSHPNEAKKRKAQLEAEVMELFTEKRAEQAGIPYAPPARAAALQGMPQSANALASSVQSNATPKGNNVTIQAIFDKWTDNKRRSTNKENGADATIKRYQRMLNDFKQSQGNLLIGNISPDHMIEFRDYLLAKDKYSNKTINCYLGSGSV